MYRSPLSSTGENILSFLLNHLGEGYSIREVANSIGQDYKIVFTTMRDLAALKLVDIQRVSNINQCSANLSKSNAHVFSYVSQRMIGTPKKIMQAIKDIIETTTNPFFSILVFGSTAKGTQTPRSDVDLLVLIPDPRQESAILGSIKKSATLNNLTINPVFMTPAEFKAGLSEPGLAREVLANHIVMYGGEAFYTLITP